MAIVVKLLNIQMRYLFIISAMLFSLQASTQGSMSKSQEKTEQTEQTFPLEKSEEQWKSELTPDQYEVLRKKGTEPRFTEIYNDPKDGIYRCSACNNPLFDAKTKYNSGSGWPAFFDIVSAKNVVLAEDRSFGMVQKEVLCGDCGGHLGHVFEDGPKPTGLRYCINSVCLDFEKSQSSDK